MMIKDFIRSNTAWFFYNLYLAKKLSDLVDMRGGKVLDFGCGNQHLRTFIFPENEYIGYDIVPEVSMVKHYTDTNPDVVIASNVFEHITAEDIERLISFCSRAKVKKLIVSFPINQWLWIWMVRIIKGREIAEDIIKDHTTSWNAARAILNKYYACTLKKHYGISQIITVWE